jgi:formylglycine-generating enzyme required for sulfatase activity
LGVGAFFGIPALQRGEDPGAAPDDDASSVKATASAADAGQADAVSGAAVGEVAGAEVDDAQVAAAEPDTASAPAETMNAEEPAAWAAAVERSNRWVEVAPTSKRVKLGLTYEQARDGFGALRTGLRPEVMFLAPDQGYRIQSHEVTWEELEQATTLAELATLERPTWVPDNARKRAKLPATGVPWSLARAFCRGMGGDLPSEAEWEWAARGPNDNYWPWGQTAFRGREVHTIAGSPVPVVAVKRSSRDRTPGKSPIFDLLGNAQEWTRDPWRPAEATRTVDPRAATHRAIRGWPLRPKGKAMPSEGSTYRSPACADASCMERDGAALEHVGFRCVSRER